MVKQSRKDIVFLVILVSLAVLVIRQRMTQREMQSLIDRQYQEITRAERLCAEWR